MSELIVAEQNGSLVVDSRLVAGSLGIEHSSFMKTVKRYETKIKSLFGTLRLEVCTSKMPDGRINPNPEKFAWLTEDQSLFLMTLSRNTDQVVDCKANLVIAFSEARKRLQPSGDRTASKALIASREVKEIHENVEYISPRLAQYLIDCCINEVIEGKALTGSDVQYRGVVEIAKEMGLPVNENNRSSLGKFVKAELIHLVKMEKRLCNGTMQDVASYPDNEEVRNRINLFFNR